MNTDDTRDDNMPADLENDTPLEASEQELPEALITAYALGELDPAESAQVERLLVDPSASAASQQVADVRALAAALRSSVADDGLPRSAELRRNVLAAVTRAEPPRAGKGRRGWSLIAGALAASLLVAVLLPAMRLAMNPTKPASRERLVADAGSAAVPPPVATAAVDEMAEGVSSRQAKQWM